MGTRRIRGSLVRLSIVAATSMVLAAGVAASDSQRFRTDLRGSNEVPAADPDGRGNATVRIDSEAGEVCFEVSVERSGTPNRAHIHIGAAGANGGIVVPFFELRENPADPRHDQLERKGRLSGCVTADPALLAAIEANPANYYVNLHNARFPGGSVRGQLGAAGGRNDDDDD